MCSGRGDSSFACEDESQKDGVWWWVVGVFYTYHLLAEISWLEIFNELTVSWGVANN